MKLRGPVRTLKVEASITTFRRDGQIEETEHHNPDGSVFRSTFAYDSSGRLLESQFGTTRVVHAYDDAGRPVRTVEISADGSERISEESTYDERGRKTTRRFLPPQPANQFCSYALEGTEQMYSAPGATAMTLHSGARGLPDEVEFHDAGNAPVAMVRFERDAAGRMMTEEYRLIGPSAWPGLPPEVAQLVFGASQTFSRTTYTYDESGRVVERNTQMGILSEERTRFRYDDRDNPIEQIAEQQSRDIEIDDNGQPHPRAELSSTQHIAFEYEYDAHGNWTCRVARTLDHTAVERREITYYPA